ncbi:hypothetical protein LINPERHAP1_LOCUS10581 [Linum perenne]
MVVQGHGEGGLFHRCQLEGYR